MMTSGYGHSGLRIHKEMIVGPQLTSPEPDGHLVSVSRAAPHPAGTAAGVLLTL